MSAKTINALDIHKINYTRCITQKVFQKTLLVSLLLSASAFATEPNLLALATGGAISAEKSATVALNDAEMKEVVGGNYYYQKTVYTYLCKQTAGTISEGYLGRPATMYARRMNNGSMSVWINYTSGGYTYQAYGTEATRLINLYGTKAKSYL
ncbi:MAG: hypothetical protein PHO62_08710 [Sulfurimonas sp.]|uniref:hypothetical protein n=1 Tax=Sulfurimonas sp. TaxID=2022749 RepID=UPI00261D98FD|nr:hypothetical protein [Sulfurimonas sp.]MDD5373492.1 hypothetical protein [Sulfurimonas sp.]